ncbi:MAG: outer membrane lipoprotein carrier protein LolA [Bacteroidia bacterium]|nr:outer membrane lipoprotein carrier protein LolA [Bacteroidia bacterium]
MRIYSILFALLLLTINAAGQNDPQAIKVLDKFSSTAMAAPSVTMKFLLINTDQVANTRDTLEGSVILSKNSYKLDLPDNIIWYNGETSWSYLPAEKEVTVTKPDKNDDSFQSRPSSLFTMYKSGYKNRLIEERSDSYIIDLYPEDIQSDLVRVRLNIANPSLNLRSFEYKRRDGITIDIIIREYSLKQVPEPGMFIFIPENYKGVEVIDMR